MISDTPSASSLATRYWKASASPPVSASAIMGLSVAAAISSMVSRRRSKRLSSASGKARAEAQVKPDSQSASKALAPPSGAPMEAVAPMMAESGLWVSMARIFRPAWSRALSWPRRASASTRCLSVMV
jgi:hypothetical protein